MPNESGTNVVTNVLITGANRGLGLALARGYLARGGCHVLAACRNPHGAAELEKLHAQHPQSLDILRMDVAVAIGSKAAATEIRERVNHIDILINNAGICPGPRHESFASLDLSFARDAFETNALGAVRVTRDFLPLLRRSSRARVVNISSGAASLSNPSVRVSGGGVNYAYAASKAALNLFTRLIASELKPENICVVAMTPGWVRTDMGGADAELAPEESSSAMIGTIDRLTLAETSLWLDRHGAVSEFSW